MEGVVSQWTAVYKNYIHCSPRCLQPHIILTDGLSLLSRHNTVCGFPSPRLHFSVNSPSWTQETPFFVCLCFSPKDGHGIECALWADPHFLGLLQMPSSSLLTYSLVFLRVGISWLVVPSLTILCVCVCVCGFHCMRLIHLGGWHFILLSPLRNQHMVLHSVGNQYILCWLIIAKADSFICWVRWRFLIMNGKGFSWG